ncbi:sulfotransferase [Thalassobacillus sp. CUG 92003]|uniref:sulfotransferase n=1 Tax=Thalassobacillus sp. CUG 92003 TaxID=2736641 RepID=UPI0015E6F56E|nr:sulfotransferase [Thalassobacillus sp. CUG 92003]
MKYLYISGLMRSGTTIVANFLNTQDHVTIYRDFLISLRNQKIDKSVLTEGEKSNLITGLQKEFDNFSLLPRVNYSDSNQLIDIYKASLRAISSPNDIIVGNKCTQSLFALEPLMTDPDVLGLYVVRDIRDVLLSTKQRYLNQSSFRESIMTKQCNQWKTEVNHAMRLQKKYPDSFYILKYEDFVQNSVSKELADFLNCKLDWSLKTYKDREGEEFLQNSSFNNTFSGGLSTSAIGRWKKDTENSAYLREAERVCKREMKQLGYM